MSRARKDPMLALAEGELIDCWKLLNRLPDRERGWLNQITLRWPAMVKDVQADYADDAAPAPGLSSREVARVNRAFLNDLCLVEAIPAPARQLCGVVVSMKAGRLPGGFEWADVGKALYGRRWGTARCDVTADALRARYEAALRCVAIRMAVWEAFGGDAAA